LYTLRCLFIFLYIQYSTKASAFYSVCSVFIEWKHAALNWTMILFIIFIWKLSIKFLSIYIPVFTVKDFRKRESEMSESDGGGCHCEESNFICRYIRKCPRVFQEVCQREQNKRSVKFWQNCKLASFVVLSARRLESKKCGTQ